MPPKEPFAFLTIKVKKAKELARMDFMKKSDPYCTVNLRGNLPQKTKVIKQDLYPIWNEEFQLDVFNDEDMLVVDMWDWDRITADDFMGLVKISVKALLDELPQEGWYNLKPGPDKPKQKTKGAVYLEYQLQLSVKYKQKEELSKQEKYEKLEALLADPSGEWIMRAVKNIKYNNEMATAIMKCCHPRVLETFMENEIKQCSQKELLFRVNTWATKMVTALMREAGSGYLQKVVDPCIRRLCFPPQEVEIDPAKTPSKKIAVTNQNTLEKQCQQFLSAILSSTEIVPDEIKNILFKIQTETVKKFPEMKSTVLGGIFFLRFIIPCIFTPEVFGCWESDIKPNTKQRRALTLVSKVLQNTANGVDFNEKEKFMIPMNEFVVGNKNKLNDFFNAIVKQCEIPVNESRHDLSDINVIYEYIKLNLDNITTFDATFTLDL